MTQVLPTEQTKYTKADVMRKIQRISRYYELDKRNLTVTIYKEFFKFKGLDYSDMGKAIKESKFNKNYKYNQLAYIDDHDLTHDLVEWILEQFSEIFKK